MAVRASPTLWIVSARRATLPDRTTTTTCNAAEKLLVHEKVAASLLPPVLNRLAEAGVEVRGGAAARAIVPEISQYGGHVMHIPLARDAESRLEEASRAASAAFVQQ